MKYLIVYVACMILTSWMSVSDAVRERKCFRVDREFEFALFICSSIDTHKTYNNINVHTETDCTSS